MVEALDPVEVAVAHALQGERPWLMTFVNPGSTIVARQHPDYAEMLREFDVVVPDGIGMSLAIRLLHRRHAARISFDTTSLAPVVFRLAARRGARIVLAGGRPGVAERARAARAGVSRHQRGRNLRRLRRPRHDHRHHSRARAGHHRLWHGQHSPREFSVAARQGRLARGGIHLRRLPRPVEWRHQLLPKTHPVYPLSSAGFRSSTSGVNLG
ncbi:MAG: WecB/TagA/CpsF family glycosyltransferase [Acetobacteraceae bacterium]|nr:WecB/TagA/CpsF family glycosyltransferase [Acetobacteraceae bacterium]